MVGRDQKAHIGIFGRRNCGKSTFINALAGQEVAIVSNVAGTTTDPVKKSIEITGVGAAVLIDTAGADDHGEVGDLRIKKTLHTIKIIDMAILVITDNTFGDVERDLIAQFKQYAVPFFIVHNKADIISLEQESKSAIEKEFTTDIIDFTALKASNPQNIYSLIAKHIPENVHQRPTIIGDIINKGDIVLLITPIDSEAPEGRMILPQVQMIRDILDNECVAIVLKENEIENFLNKTGIKPQLAITDSQVFDRAHEALPSDIPLTSFSIVLARHKGDFETYTKGIEQLSKLQDGDKILMLESCTHEITCEDIGRVKIPNWIRKHTGKELQFDILSGLSDLPENVFDYALLIQCGGCMVTEKQIKSRLKQVIDRDIPVTNYGMTIAYLKGIYDKAIAPFTQLTEEIEDAIISK